MSYQLKLRLTASCEDTQEAEDEMEELSSYIGQRISDGADESRVVQAMIEALIEIGEDDFNDTLH
tara:strand:+ start:420 stop:614 length:195 start_codon:yes stop_codon:yes gene_type:complete